MKTTARLLAPSLLLIALVVLPIVRGERTWFLRDVFQTHLPFKAAAAQAYAQGAVPLLDPFRAGGQPLLGNPNAVSLYPTDFLYLISPLLWAFNAHFWLHWLLAPLAMAWLARTWGLAPAGAAAAGATYAASGFFISQLSFYNLIGAATVAPALVAAATVLAAPPSARAARFAAAAAAASWGLLLLAGDPLSAVLALALAAASGLLRRRTAVAPAGRHAGGLPLLALATGTLLAAPQLLEFVRILPRSLRGQVGVGGQSAAVVASLDPRQVAEWVLPFAFGRPDLLEAGRFWGFRFFTEWLPLYPTLFPGLLCWVLVAAAGRPRAAVDRLAWGAVATALFFALGRFNPLAAPLFSLGGLLRYPIKCWLVGAIGAALLCGRGLDQLAADQAARRRARWTLGALFGGLMALALTLWLAPGVCDRLLASWMTSGPGPGTGSPPAAMVAAERARQLATVVLSVASLALTAALLRRQTVAPGWTGWLLGAHVASQLFLLAPARVTDLTAPYGRPSPLLAAVPAGARLAHGEVDGLFAGGSVVEGEFPQPHVVWLSRALHGRLHPPTGVAAGVHYELNPSPEGLDSFLVTAVRDLVRQLGDEHRLHLLAAAGVTHLVLQRPLDPAARELVEPLASATAFGRTADLYRLRAALPEVSLLTSVLRVADHRAAAAVLTGRGFDPRRTVVLVAPEDSPGARPPASAASPPGRAWLLERGDESLRVGTAAPQAGVLLVQRAHLDLWRASVDGVAVPVETANLARLAVRVPAGRHEVRLWVDRRLFALGLGCAALGALLGVGLVVAGGRMPREGRG